MTVACDMCRGVGVIEAPWAEVWIDPDNCLRVENMVGGTIRIPIRYCPECGQDLREVISADTE